MPIPFTPFETASLQVPIPMACQEFYFWIEKGDREESKKERTLWCIG
jgi:hypothetical protein